MSKTTQLHVEEIYVEEIKQCNATIEKAKKKRKHLKKLLFAKREKGFNEYHGLSVGERSSLIDHDNLSCFGPPEEF